jgi:hypothetical protein
LFDRLRQALGHGRVFMDVDGIPPGEPFAKQIDQWLAQAEILIALIGPRWMGEGDPPRIRRQDDFVRLELAAALRRQLRVVPVLVNDARLPNAADLTPDIAELLTRNAIRLYDESFDDDANRLIRALRPRASARNGWWAASAAGLLALVGIVAYVAIAGYAPRPRTPPPALPRPRESAPVVVNAAAVSTDTAPKAAVVSVSPAPLAPKTPTNGTPTAASAVPNDGRIRAPDPADYLVLKGPYCRHEDNSQLGWTTRIVGYGPLFLWCYASLETCQQQVRLDNGGGGPQGVCKEAPKLWCYYEWNRERDGREKSGPVRCSARRDLCERERVRALKYLRKPAPEHVGTIAYSGECHVAITGR